MSYQNLHLDEGESVILEVRKHWIVFAGIALGFALAGLLPFIVYTAFSIFIPSVIDFELSEKSVFLFLFIYILWLLTLWIMFFVDWTKYYLDVWYVTEKRIIAINQKHVFSREISNLRFDKIQDITVDVHGFIATMLGFGNVKVQTAGEDSKEFTAKTIKHPEMIRRVIFGRQNIINETKETIHS